MLLSFSIFMHTEFICLKKYINCQHCTLFIIDVIICVYFHLINSSTFEHIWQEVAKNIKGYRSFPRLIGGKRCCCDSHFICLIMSLQVNDIQICCKLEIPFYKNFINILNNSTEHYYRLQNAEVRISTSCMRQRTSRAWSMEQCGPPMSTEARNVPPVPGCTLLRVDGMRSEMV